jgi:lysophospholipase L1-like esterase
VALGDSYTAGPRIPDRTGAPAGCDRSDHDYPALVAERLGLRAADFRDVSCSGATVADLTTPQSTDDGTNPAQLSALSAGTRLVTLGIGGNDIGFASLVTTCVKAGVFYDLTSPPPEGGGFLRLAP